MKEIIRFIGREPHEVLGEIPPHKGLTAIEKLAINKVAAGCLAEYFPIVIAAVEVMCTQSKTLMALSAPRSEHKLTIYNDSTT